MNKTNIKNLMGMIYFDSDGPDKVISEFGHKKLSCLTKKQLKNINKSIELTPQEALECIHYGIRVMMCEENNSLRYFKEKNILETNYSRYENTYNPNIIEPIIHKVVEKDYIEEKEETCSDETYVYTTKTYNFYTTYLAYKLYKHFKCGDEDNIFDWLDGLWEEE